MDVVSFGSGDNLSVPQYHFKVIFIAFCLLVWKQNITTRGDGSSDVKSTEVKG